MWEAAAEPRANPRANPEPTPELDGVGSGVGASLYGELGEAAAELPAKPSLLVFPTPRWLGSLDRGLAGLVPSATKKVQSWPLTDWAV